jgi:predicted  nucleic acid-binding Zn-ribbon protein
MSTAEIITIVIAALALLLTIAGFLVALGRRDARLDNLEDRMKEDRERNSDQHAEFYATARAVTGLEVEVKNLGESIKTLSADVRAALNRLPAERA